MRRIIICLCLIAMMASAATSSEKVLSPPQTRPSKFATLALPTKGNGGKVTMLSRERKKSDDRRIRTYAASEANRRAVTQAPAKVSRRLPIIYGNVMWESTLGTTDRAYLARIPANEEEDFETIIPRFDAGYGGVCVDGIYYGTNFDDSGFYDIIEVNGYDVATGELEFYCYPSNKNVLAPAGMAVDPVSGKIYGIFYNSDGTGVELGTIEYKNESARRTGTVSALEGSWCAFAISSSGTFYGIRKNIVGTGDNARVVSSTLCKIDRATGDVEDIGITGFIPAYISGACIDPKTDRMFWAVSPADGTGVLTEVNLSTGAATLLYHLPNEAEVSGMYVVGSAAADKAPDEVQSAGVVFNGGSLTGTATVKAPATLFDGSQATGQVDIKIAVAGEVLATKKASYGSEVSIPVTMQQPGLYDFAVYAENSAGMSPQKIVKGVFAGTDTPSASTNVSLSYADGRMQLSWDAVTAGVNGGYIDVGGLSYTVTRYPGAVKVAQGHKSTTFSEPIGEPNRMEIYYYTVVAVSNGVESAPAKSNSIKLGAITPPYIPDFNTDGLEGWLVLDENNDGKTWTVWGQNELRIAYNTTKTMNDWLISPPIRLRAGREYEVSFEVYAYDGDETPERIEVKYGTDASVQGLDRTLLPPTVVTQSSANPLAVNKKIVPTADGIYYIGFHGMSDKNMYYLYLRNIEIGAGVLDDAPGVATDLSVTPDADGALKAHVAFKAPSVSASGTALSGITKIELSRDDEVVKTFTSPSPGAGLSFDDIVPQRGMHEYSVVCFNNAGDGVAVTQSAFIGHDLPVGIEGVQIRRTDNEGEVAITWNPVTKDINGLNMSSADVKYNLSRITDDGSEPLVADLSEPRYVFQLAKAGKQDFIKVEVVPENVAGIGAGMESDLIPAGTPYKGLAESGALDTYVWGTDDAGGGVWAYTYDSNGVSSQDGDGKFFLMEGKFQDDSGDLMSGLVTLEGMSKPGLVFYTYNTTGDEGQPNINEISVALRESDKEAWTEIYNSTVDRICGSMPRTWGKVAINLGEYAGKVIQIKITPTIKQYSYVMVDNITIGNLLDYDVNAKKISASTHAHPGEEFNVEVQVLNEGVKVIDNVKVELYENGTLADTRQIGAMASGALQTLAFVRTMAVADPVALEYYAVVSSPSDQNPDNNRTETITVQPRHSGIPAVTALVGESDGHGIRLTWNEPDLDALGSLPVFEDFETATPFADHYDDWTFIDVDNAAVAGFQNWNIPGITPGTTRGSFWVWDSSQLGDAAAKAHSGSKYLFSLCLWKDGKVVDDWAVSPLLNGEAQTISFWAKSYSSEYAERISVYYSTGGTEVADFVKIDGVGGSVPGVWTLYTAELPAGAKHFAIRSSSTNPWMLMIDDVSYIPGKLNVSLLGYNVYRDGRKINSAILEENEFVDTDLEDGKTYSYVVTAVYNKGESEDSNVVSMKFEASGLEEAVSGDVQIVVADGEIIILHAGGREIAVTVPNGSMIYSGIGSADTRIAVAPGVYIVKAGSTVKKIIVR